MIGTEKGRKGWDNEDIQTRKQKLCEGSKKENKRNKIE
jgi:hypothetical protein